MTKRFVESFLKEFGKPKTFETIGTIKSDYKDYSPINTSYNQFEENEKNLATHLLCTRDAINKRYTNLNPSSEGHYELKILVFSYSL